MTQEADTPSAEECVAYCEAASRTNAGHGFQAAADKWAGVATRLSQLETENRELREALGWFLNDERFQVSIGGNPIVVCQMIHNARQALNKGPTR